MCHIVFHSSLAEAGSHQAIQSPHLGATISLLSERNCQRIYPRESYPATKQCITEADTAAAPARRLNVVARATERLDGSLGGNGLVVPEDDAVLGTSGKLRHFDSVVSLENAR